MGMDLERIRDRQVMERYLQGTLTAEEEAAFEEAYVADPALAEELELVERLRQGIRSVEGRAAARTPSKQRRGSTWLRAIFSPQYAMAASVLLAASLVLSVMLYRQNVDLRETWPIPSAGNARVLPLVAVRGSDANAIPAPAAGELTVLLVEPGLEEHDTYRASLRRVEGRTTAEVWTAEALEPSYEGMVAVWVPSTVLRPGRYEMEVAGRDVDWPASRGYESVSVMPIQVTQGR